MIFLSIMSTKWLITVVALGAILFILFMIGKKEVKTSVEIQAPVSEVWKALESAENMRAWNKVLIPLAGELIAGEKVTYKFVQDEKSTSELAATVYKIEQEKLINQGGGPVGLLTFNHSYMLEPIDDGTRVTIHEVYKGIMVPFWNPKAVELAYERVLQQLKTFVENE
jgi:hypothetical protein